MSDRQPDAVRRVAALLDELARSEPRPLVAVDGPDAAGKTTFADSVAGLMTASVCRASVDGFHRPAEARAARGSLSPEGCYRDSFDYGAFLTRLVEPFADGASEVATAVFDHASDRPREQVRRVGPRCLLLVDGVFLLRPELRHRWTFAVYLHVPEDVTLARALQRDTGSMGSPHAVAERYRTRYLPAQRLYRAEADPLAAAHVVIDNSDVDAPQVIRWTA